MMEKIQAWIEKHLVPVVNKITSNFWFGIVADAILYIVPFSMVSAIPSLWAILRRFVPVLPDISPLSTFSFGLIGLFVVFVIPYNCLQKIEKKDRSMIAGFTGLHDVHELSNGGRRFAGFHEQVRRRRYVHCYGGRSDGGCHLQAAGQVFLLW